MTEANLLWLVAGMVIGWFVTALTASIDLTAIIQHLKVLRRYRRR